MNTRKIFIANLSKGVLGEAGTQLLGSLLVTQFQTTSLGRATRPIQSRTPFYLYIDEVHSFITKSFSDILSESRKYGLSLFLTHQFIDQLPEEIQKSIIGNVGTLITFRIGTADTKILAQEFFPVFTETDLVNLPRYHIYIKLLIDGTTSKPFSAVTLPIKEGSVSNTKVIQALSQKRYGKPIAEVEEALFIKHEKGNRKTTASLFS